MILSPGSLDSMLPPDHVVRAVDAFVAALDLAPLYDAIKAREGHPGHPPADPRLVVALWLYATIDGVGSARELARLCLEALPYQWLCGGVSMNHHSLSDARLRCAAWLDQALSHSIAALLRAGVISLDTVAQDGLRVRAAAGAGSFYRAGRLHQFLSAAQAQVGLLRQELEGDAAASSKRKQAARQRAADDRARRVRQAVAALPEAEARAQRNKKTAEQARVSTTDAEARMMKIPGGGFRPAYNTQLACETEHGLIVGLDVTCTGADQPSLVPMVRQIQARTGRTPRTVMADGGFYNKDSVRRLTAAGIELLIPPHVPHDQTRQPGERARKDTQAVADLRRRMEHPDTKVRYRERARWIEWVNAGYRNRGWQQVMVRGRSKVLALAHWQALAHNATRILASARLSTVFGLQPKTSPA